MDTLVIGGGQAGLAMGYHLSRQGLSHAIVDANDRIGDAWRNRWDSLRLFTPNRLNGLPGMPFPGYHWGFPSKNEMADYLESYARHFDIPVETGVRVERLSRDDDVFVAAAGDREFAADNVVVASRAGRNPGSRTLQMGSTAESFSSMPPTTRTLVNSREETCSSSERVIRERR